jgi:tetratricopeptide (TPR) repeat protein
VFRLWIEQTGPSSWRAHSRLGAARAFVSAPKYLWGRLLGKVPAGGAIVYVDGGTIDTVDGVPRLRGQMQSPFFGRYHIDARLTGQTLRGELKRDSAGARVGDLHAVPDSTERRLRDYPAVAATIRRELAQYIFDPRLATTAPFREFFAALDRGFADAHDDLDALIAFYSRVQRVGISHIDLLRDPVLANQPLEALVNRVWGPPDSLARLSFPVPGIAYLWVRKWDQVTPAIDRAFSRIDQARAHTLILDMRGNPGGDNSAGAPLAHLFREQSDVGVMLTNKWWRSHAGPPTPEQLRTLPVVTRDEGMEIIHTMRDSGTVAIRIKPRTPYFEGRVFVLVDGGSGSASEPPAYHLKVTGRATLIGKRTAGAVLAQLPHNVGEDFVLLIPEADYYAADGTRLEGNGVTPHIEATSQEAALAAAREIERYQPVDGAVFVAVSAIPLARWDTAFAALDRALAARPNDLAALYQVGRAAAESKRHLDKGEQALRSYLATPPKQYLSTHAAAHWRLGMILQHRGDTEGARREYATALQLDPKHAGALAAIGALNAAKPD